MTYTAAFLSFNEARYLNDEDDTVKYIDTVEVYEDGDSLGTIEVESSDENAPYDEAVKELTGGQPVEWIDA